MILHFALHLHLVIRYSTTWGVSAREPTTHNVHHSPLIRCTMWSDMGNHRRDVVERYGPRWHSGHGHAQLGEVCIYNKRAFVDIQSSVSSWYAWGFQRFNRLLGPMAHGGIPEVNWNPVDSEETRPRGSDTFNTAATRLNLLHIRRSVIGDLQMIASASSQPFSDRQRHPTCVFCAIASAGENPR